MLDEIRSDLKHIVAKYQNSHSSEEILQTLSRIIDLEIATSLLHVRMDQNIYEIFEKNDFELIGTGRLLKDISRVVYVHKAKTCLQYYNEAIIEFSASNLNTILVLNNTISEVVDTDNHIKHTRKRKLDLKPKNLVQESKDLPLLRLKYIFNEHTIDNTISANNRTLGVSVMENPTKSINLTIYAYHGVAGLDEQVVIDFQMLTASFSPSTERILIDQMDFNDNISCGSNSNNNVQSDNVCEDNNSNDSIEISNKVDVVDKADYYNVNVNMDVLVMLSKWMLVKSSNSCTDTNDDSISYDTHPELKDTLMFLLSLPYVDEAWGIHDLILDHELGNEDDTSDSCAETNDD